MAYSSPAAPVRSARGSEYTAFLEITRALKKASAEKNRKSVLRVEALMRNRQLWTILAANVAAPDNELPPPLRAQLFYLYEFTVEHSRKVLAGEETLDALIDVNTSVMQGLMSEQQAL